MRDSGTSGDLSHQSRYWNAGPMMCCEFQGHEAPGGRVVDAASVHLQDARRLRMEIRAGNSQGERTPHRSQTSFGTIRRVLGRRNTPCHRL